MTSTHFQSRNYGGSSFGEKQGCSMVAVISVPGGESYDHPLNTGSYQVQIEASRVHESRYRLLLYIHVICSCPVEVVRRLLSQDMFQGTTSKGKSSHKNERESSQ